MMLSYSWHFKQYGALVVHKMEQIKHVEIEVRISILTSHGGVQYQREYYPLVFRVGVAVT